MLDLPSSFLPLYYYNYIGICIYPTVLHSLTFKRLIWKHKRLKSLQFKS